MKVINLNKFCKRILGLLVILVVIIAVHNISYAEPVVPRINLEIGTSDNPKDVSSSIQVLLLITILSLAPSILIMMTSFTRIIIVLSFLRNALGTQQMPPNQVLIGLALFLSLFIMSPVLSEINTNAYQPYTKGEISQQEALNSASKTIKTFMVKQIVNNKREKDLAFFINLSEAELPESKEDLPDLPFNIVAPAFLISELATAFKIGFLIYLPFLIIDMVVSSTLMAMGMMMLPPVMISLPFKILIFVMVDGWNLVIQSLVKTFY
mgnify:CR=1 FL=1